MRKCKGAMSRLAAIVLLTSLVWLSAASPAAAKATEDDLNKVKAGMTRTEVLDLMGRPDRDQEVKDEEEVCRLYVYKNVGRYKVVNIWFDCQDKVRYIDKAR
ncbi:MAG: outer membrane protein assembly factor BamE [Acidobacteria bacterium]|nr:outer membrane protein assembly factor BamE [Acidobacteriota bacterium]